MPILNPKQPTEVALYELSFALAFKESADVIESYTLAVASGTVTIDNDWATDTSVYATIGGGANGVTQTLALEVTTALGQTLKRTYSLLVSNTAISVTNSTNTKRQIVEMAFEEATLAGYEFDATPEEYASILRRLDALMGEWQQTGLDLSYNFPPSFGGSDLDDASGVPDFAVNAVAVSLGLRYFPAIGKTMSPESRVALGNGMNAIRAYCAMLPQTQLPPSTLRGAGAKPLSTWAPFNGAGNGR